MVKNLWYYLCMIKKLIMLIFYLNFVFVCLEGKKRRTEYSL